MMKEQCLGSHRAVILRDFVRRLLDEEPKL